MGRIAYPVGPPVSQELADYLGSRRDLNLYRMLPHAAHTASGFLRLGQAVLRESELPARLREIAVLRVGFISQATYEIHQHRQIGAAAGLTAAQIEIIEHWPQGAALEGIDQVVLAFTDQVVRQVRADDTTWQALLAAIGSRQIAELTMTIGFYMLVCRYLENFDIEIEQEPERALDGRLPFSSA